MRIDDLLDMRRGRIDGVTFHSHARAMLLPGLEQRVKHLLFRLGDVLHSSGFSCEHSCRSPVISCEEDRTLG